MMFLQILTLLGALAMFLYGMILMSSGVQKAAGNRLRSILSKVTSNPFKGILTGFGITSIIQSSSATTVLVVSLVSAGLLTLSQAIGVIMGANIGTTVTAWIISLLGFKFDISSLAIPLFLVGFILSQLKNERRRHTGEFIIGFSILFLGLALIKSSMPDLSSSPETLSFIQKWGSYGIGSTLLFVLFGTVLTLILQSSSATMALTLVMVNQGWISFEMGAAMVLGENIGTTVTANIAAAVGDVNGKRAAIAHTLFNVFGVIWVLILFNPFLLLNRTLTELLGEFNPLIGLSMFHSLFNATNTMVLVWFIPMIERMVTKIIPDRTTKRDKTRLRYISGGPVATPELGASQALLETIHFAQISRNEITLIDNAVQNLNTPDFEEHRNQLVRYEEIADNIEKEISAFLNKLTEYETSLETSKMINALYRIISEIERLGDSGESISRILARMKTRNIVLSEERKQGISKMLTALQDAYDTMISNLRSATRPNMDNFDGEAAIENEMAINILRNRLRDEEFARLEENGITDYVASNLYLDVIVEIERMGDFIINISQALEE